MSQVETDKEQTKVWDNGGNLDILLPTIGSAGDVHPVIELGSALKKRGHQPQLSPISFSSSRYAMPA